MKIGLVACACLVAATAAFSSPAYDSLEALMKDMQQKQSAALEEYVKGHADAADIERARAVLVMALLGSEEFAKALPFLRERYAALLLKKEDMNLRTDFAMVVDPLFASIQRVEGKDKAKAFIGSVRKDFEMHKDAEQIGKFLVRMEKQLNRPAAGEAFTLKFTSLDGKEVDLAKMKDKVVLVDFWATWCGPCRNELPFVKEAYKKYHDKGFEIVGISLDQERAKLDDFLKKEEIPWAQYFTGDGWETDLAQQHGITSIPATFLVGKDGKVAATDLRGKKLEEKVAELLK
jgi:thiol-disulfide isomerase/thioredoxin